MQNLAQYLTDEQKKMMELWNEIQRVRRQFEDLKTSTERDLESQKTEFNRAMRSVGGITRTYIQSGDDVSLIRNNL